MNKKIVLIVFFMTIGVVSSYAGTTDTLGMEGLWDRISGILTDKYLNPIITVALIGMGIYQWTKGGGIWIAIIFGTLGMIVSELKSIAEAISGAMIF